MAYNTITLNVRETPPNGVSPTFVTVLVYPMSSLGTELKTITDSSGHKVISGHAVVRASAENGDDTDLVQIVLPDPADVTLNPHTFGYKVQVRTNYFGHTETVTPAQIADLLAAGVLELESFTDVAAETDFDATLTYATHGDLTAEAQRAEAAESTNAADITAETTRATGVEGTLAPKASPALTGNPTAPTQAPGNNSTRLATTAYTDAAVSVEAAARATAITSAVATAVNNLVNGAPGALDTLKELADAVNDDASFAASVTAALAGKVPQSRLLAGLDLTVDRSASDLVAALGTALSASFVAKDASVYRVLDHGLVADAVELTNVSIALGSNVLTCPDVDLTTLNLVGKCITIRGAGAAGAFLNSSPSNALRTVLSVTAHTLTFDDPLHGVALSAVRGPRTVSATTVALSNQITITGDTFDASDISKRVTLPNCCGSLEQPVLLAQYASMASGSAVLTATLDASDVVSFPASLTTGRLVRVARAGSTANAPLIARIVSRDSATQLTLDTVAAQAVSNVEVYDLGDLTSLDTVITKVVDGATTATIRRRPDLAVTGTMSIEGQTALVATDNQPALNTLLAAIPAGSVVEVPRNALVGLMSGTVSLAKPVRFVGHGPGSGFHVGASSRWSTANGGDGVTYRGMDVQALQAAGVVSMFSLASTAQVKNFKAIDCRFIGVQAKFARPGRVGNTGTQSTTGSGHAELVRLVRCEHTNVCGDAVVYDGITRGLIAEGDVHHNGIDTNTGEGIKILSGSSGIKVVDTDSYRNARDGMDVYDSVGTQVLGGLYAWNGVNGVDNKWIASANYNIPEQHQFTGVRAIGNGSIGISFNSNNSIFTACVASSNLGNGGRVADETTTEIVGTRHTIIRDFIARSNGADGLSAGTAGGPKFIIFDGIQAHANGGSGASFGGSDHFISRVVAFDNKTAGVRVNSTSARIRIDRSQTQDTDGIARVDAGATYILKNGYGAETVAPGAQPSTSLANWPLGSIVEADSKVWVRVAAGWTNITPAAAVTVTYPSHVGVPVLGTPVDNSNWAGNPLYGTSPARWYGGYVSSTVQNAYRSWDVVLQAGTWTLDLLYSVATDGGIYTVSIDGTDIGTIDGYAAAAAPTYGSITGIAVASTGVKRVKIRMATKNASSTSYVSRLSGLSFTRTGA